MMSATETNGDIIAVVGLTGTVSAMWCVTSEIYSVNKALIRKTIESRSDLTNRSQANSEVESKETPVEEISFVFIGIR